MSAEKGPYRCVPNKTFPGRENIEGPTEIGGAYSPAVAIDKCADLNAAYAAGAATREPSDPVAWSPNSTELIGNVRQRWEELVEQRRGTEDDIPQWAEDPWRSFYHGWLEGRSQLIGRAATRWSPTDEEIEQLVIEAAMNVSDDFGNGMKHGIRYALSRSIGQQQGLGAWIPVSERLPDYDEEVLWCDAHGGMWVEDIGHDDTWENFQAVRSRDVFGGPDDTSNPITHWMPLPAPPQQEQP